MKEGKPAFFLRADFLKMCWAASLAVDVHVRSCCSSDLNGALALKLMHGHVAGGRRRATSLAASFLPLTETQDSALG